MNFLSQVRGYKKKTELTDQYCKKWNLKCNLSESKIMVFQKGVKLKATESWRMNVQNSGIN
jgi:hypothetical protein